MSLPNLASTIDGEPCQPEYQDFVEVLIHRATGNPDKEACNYLNESVNSSSVSVTYLDLDRAARRIAKKLQKHLMAGDRIILLFKPGVEFISAFFGCLYAGVIAVPVNLPKFSHADRGISRLKSIVSNSQADLLFTSAEIKSSASNIFSNDSCLKNLKYITIDEADQYSSEEWIKPDIQPETIAFLQYTSGSTSQPKGVKVSHSNLIHNISAISSAFKMSNKSKGIIWLPPYHDMGLIGGILSPIFNGFSLTLMPPALFIKNPLRWLKIISDQKGTISGGPNFAYDLCVRQMLKKPVKDLDLSSWEVAFCGSEPVRLNTMQAFIETFAPFGFHKEAFNVCYGLAENTLMATSTLLSGNKNISLNSSDDDNKIRNAGQVVSCGKVIPGHELIIVDKDTFLPLPEGNVGEVWVNGPSVSSGYWDNADLTNELFNASVTNNYVNIKWLRTGDLGFLRNEELYISGRIKDLIIIGGNNYYPHDIEQIAEKAHPLLRPFTSAAFVLQNHNSQELVLIQEIKSQPEENNYHEIIPKIRYSVLKEIGLYFHHIVLVRHGTIPRTPSGKVQRNLCLEMYKAGEIVPIYQSTKFEDVTDEQCENDENIQFHFSSKEDIVRLVIQLLTELTGLDSNQIDTSATFLELGIDSIQLINLINKVGDLFHHTFNVDLPYTISIDSFAHDVFHQANTSIKINNQETDPSNEQAHDLVSLNPGQLAIYFNCMLNPATTTYNISKAIKFNQPIDMMTLTKSINVLINRHASLRSTILEDDGRQYQRIYPHIINNTVNVYDSYLSDSEVIERIENGSNMLFDLHSGPLVRFNVYKTTSNETFLLFSSHHIIMDFWSIAILLNDLKYIYAGLSESDNINASNLIQLYNKNFNKLYEDYLSSENHQIDWLFWKNSLSGYTQNANPPRISLNHHKTERFHFSLGEELSKDIAEYSKRNQVTIYNLLFTAFQCLLYSVNGNKDSIIGTPFALRNWSGADKFIGYCVNLLPVRVLLSPDACFSDQLLETQRILNEVFKHNRFPFIDLIQRLNVDRLPNKIPLIKNIFVYQRNHLNNGDDLELFALGASGSRTKFGEIDISSLQLPIPDSQTELNLVIIPSKHGLFCSFEYNDGLFHANEIEVLSKNFSKFLHDCTGSLNKLIYQLTDFSIPLPQAQYAERKSANNTGKLFPHHSLCIDQLFQLSVDSYPEKIALISSNRCFTYTDLQIRANQLSNYLLEYGNKSNELIAIIMEKGWEQVLACLGILGAGFAYLPIDPDLPRDRINAILSDANVNIILTQSHHISRIQSSIHHIIAVDEIADNAITNYSKVPPVIPRVNHQLAYVIYTSGSTGLPKGVMIEHRSAVNTILDINNRFNVNSDDTVLGLSSLSFDLSVYDIFGIFAAGGTLVLPEQSQLKDPYSWLSLIAQHSITIWNSVPMLVQMLVEVLKNKSSNPLIALNKIRLILLSGDYIPYSLPSEINKYLTNEHEIDNKLSIVSMGGATECSIWSIYHVIKELPESWKSIPYGKPLANQHIYIMNDNLHPCLDFVPGEILIGGDGLARGYWNDTNRTDMQFIIHPVTRERLYRTGDLGMYWPDATIEFLGRKDTQVKIDGYRIELDEIQLVLMKYAKIKFAIPIICNRNSTMIIVAFVVLNQISENDEKNIREYLQAKLPAYMLPKRYIFIDEVPLTTNGKIDNSSLLKKVDEIIDINTDISAHQNDIHCRLLQIWSVLLNLKNIRMNDSFFALGGTSLLAVKMVEHIRREFNVKMEVVDVFQLLTIEKISSVILGANETEKEQLIKKIPRIPYKNDRYSG